MRKLLLAVLFVLTVSFAGIADALPSKINGDIGFGMSAILEDAAGLKVGNALLATQVDFDDALPNGRVTMRTGDYSHLDLWDTKVIFNDFSFLPSTAPLK